MQSSTGDYAMHHSSTMRIVARIRPYYKDGILENGVSSIKVTAMEVIKSNNACCAEHEVYREYQTDRAQLRFLCNRAEVAWGDSGTFFNTCGEVCDRKSILNESEKVITVLFLD